MPAPKQEEDDWNKVDYHEFPKVIVDFDKTSEVIGTLLWKETVVTAGLNGEPRDSTMYAFVSADGQEFGVWGTANLDPQLAKVSEGQAVKITGGVKESIGGGKTMRRFEVFTR